MLGLGWVSLAQGGAADSVFPRAREIAPAIGDSPVSVGADRSRALAAARRPVRVAMGHFERALLAVRASGGWSLPDPSTGTTAAASSRQRPVPAIPGPHPRDRPRHLRVRGPARSRTTALRRGAAPRGARSHQEALDLAADLDQAAEQVRAHDGLDHVELALGHPEPVQRHGQRALPILDPEAILDQAATTSFMRTWLASLRLRAVKNRATPTGRPLRRPPRGGKSGGSAAVTCPPPW